MGYTGGSTLQTGDWRDADCVTIPDITGHAQLQKCSSIDDETVKIDKFGEQLVHKGSGKVLKISDDDYLLPADKNDEDELQAFKFICLACAPPSDVLPCQPPTSLV